MTPSEKRFLLLFTFLKKNRKKKVMVFCSSCMEVKFLHELLNYIDIPVQCIHVSNLCLEFIFAWGQIANVKHIMVYEQSYGSSTCGVCFT